MKTGPLCLAAVLMGTSAGSAAAQTHTARVDSFAYARLGYGAVLAAGGSANPAMGFGYRGELGAFGLDVSFFNEQLPSSNALENGSGAMAGSLLKLEALYFAKPKANASAYVGGGISVGATSLSGAYSSTVSSSWGGSGLQGELTAGYELLRASSLRFFVQSDATLPLYRVTGTTYSYSRGLVSETSAGRRYAPSIVISAGMGWRRHRV